MQDLVRQIRGKKILVVGDFIVDHYRILSPQKLSPEAPVLIFSQQRDEYRLGGAGNVANNLADLGCDVQLASIVGEDWHGGLASKFPENFSRTMFPCPGRATTVKERLVTKRQQVARIDTQSNEKVSCLVAGQFGEKVFPMIPSHDVIVLSDYGHGAMVPSLTIPIIKHAKRAGKKVVVDSKAADTHLKYKGASIMLPNETESREMTRRLSEPIDDIARLMLRVLEMDAIGMTLGPNGILLVGKDGEELLPAYGGDEVVDITGAGDTVCAAVSSMLATGASYREAIEVANVAAGIVVGKMGVATVSAEEMFDALSRKEE